MTLKEVQKRFIHESHFAGGREKWNGLHINQIQPIGVGSVRADTWEALERNPDCDGFCAETGYQDQSMLSCMEKLIQWHSGMFWTPIRR